jgi:hypothetical protein
VAKALYPKHTENSEIARPFSGYRNPFASDNKRPVGFGSRAIGALK